VTPGIVGSETCNKYGYQNGDEIEEIQPAHNDTPPLIQYFNDGFVFYLAGKQFPGSSVVNFIKFYAINI